MIETDCRKLQLRNALKEPPSSTTTIEEDTDRIVDGKINRLAIAGLPGSGKTTLANCIAEKVAEKSKKRNIAFTVIINEIFDKKQHEAHIERSGLYVSNETKFWHTLSNEIFYDCDHLKPKSNVAEILLIPASGLFDTGRTTIEKIADGINKRTEAWEKAMIYYIAPPSKSELIKRIEARKEKHNLVAKHKGSKIKKEVLFEKVSDSNTPSPAVSPVKIIKPPPHEVAKECPPGKIGHIRLGQAVFVGNFAAEHIHDIRWAKMRENIQIPEGLQEECNKSGDHSQIYSYKSNAAQAAYWLYDILRLDPSSAKVIASP